MKRQMKVLSILLLGLAPAMLCAQEFPSKTVRVIVAFPAGSSTDVISRVVGAKLSQSLSQPVIIENRPGVSGNIAAQVAAKAPADGHTVLAYTSSFAINLSLYKNPGFAEKDFIPVILAGATPGLIFTHPSVPANNLQELFALARTRPMNYVSGGTGSQLMMDVLKKETRTDITHVPFAPAAAVTAVVGNQAPIGFTSIPMPLAQVRAGKLKPIAVTTARRVAVLPDVPTVAESGFPGFEDAVWFAFFVPAGTPGAVVARLNADLNRAMDLPDVREKFAGLNIEFSRNSQAEFAEFLRKEIAKYAKAVQETGAKAE